MDANGFLPTGEVSGRWVNAASLIDHHHGQRRLETKEVGLPVQDVEAIALALQLQAVKALAAGDIHLLVRRLWQDRRHSAQPLRRHEAGHSGAHGEMRQSLATAKCQFFFVQGGVDLIAAFVRRLHQQLSRQLPLVIHYLVDREQVLRQIGAQLGSGGLGRGLLLFRFAFNRSGSGFLRLVIVCFGCLFHGLNPSRRSCSYGIEETWPLPHRCSAPFYQS